MATSISRLDLMHLYDVLPMSYRDEISLHDAFADHKSEILRASSMKTKNANAYSSSICRENMLLFKYCYKCSTQELAYAMLHNVCKRNKCMSYQTPFVYQFPKTFPINNKF